jgi:hypothetical protein
LKRTIQTVMVIAGITIAGSSVNAFTQEAPAPAAATPAADAEQARLLAVALREAIDTTVATDYPSETEAQQVAIAAALQGVIVASGASPIVVLSALAAVRYCPTGVVTSTTGLPATPALIPILCDGILVKPIDEPTDSALAALQGQVLALLEGEQPAALSGGFFGGLGFPASAGLEAGGSDYIS